MATGYNKKVSKNDKMNCQTVKKQQKNCFRAEASTAPTGDNHWFFWQKMPLQRQYRWKARQTG